MTLPISARTRTMPNSPSMVRFSAPVSSAMVNSGRLEPGRPAGGGGVSFCSVMLRPPC